MKYHQHALPTNTAGLTTLFAHRAYDHCPLHGTELSDDFDWCYLCVQSDRRDERAAQQVMEAAERLKRRTYCIEHHILVGPNSTCYCCETEKRDLEECEEDRQFIKQQVWLREQAARFLTLEEQARAFTAGCQGKPKRKKGNVVPIDDPPKKRKSKPKK